MKRTHALRSLVISTTLCGAQVLFLLSPLHAYADFGLPKTSPYTFGPEGRALQDLVDFATPIKMVDFPAHQPVQSTDQYGKKLFYNTSGKLIMSVNVDGSMVTYTAKGTRSFDADGKLIEETEVLEGTNRSVTRNEHGEVTGYSTRAFGSQLSQEFDADGNLLRTYGYADYAKSAAWVRNELSQTKTIHNDLNQPEKDVDFEGNTIATYKYDTRGKLVSKTDVYNNVTSFDETGRMAYTTNAKGERIMTYEYRYDEKGNNILDKTIDMSPGIYGGDVTTFHNNMQVETKSKFGGIATKYQYRGHTLVYTFDTRTNEVTWYNKYGQQTVSTFDGEVVRQHLHYKSRYVGFIDHRANRVVLYQYERQDQEVKFFRAEDMPSADEIEKYYEALMKMNDVIPTDKNPAKQPEAIVRQNAIPLDGPSKIPARVMALVTAKTAESFSEPAKNTITKKQYHYAGGKLQSIVGQNLADGSGLTTQIFIGDSVFTTTRDMSSKATVFASIWNAVMAGKNLADITSGTGEMAEVAGTIKSLDLPGDKIPGMSDIQLCNLLGWDMNAINTAACLKDIRVRNANAGKHGNITISYGFGEDQSSNRLCAAAVSGTNVDDFSVSGQYASKMLDITTTEARDSVTSRTAKSGYIAGLGQASGQDTANEYQNEGTSEEFLDVKTLPAGTFMQTVSGVTRAYANNGNILYEIDTLLGNTTLFDAFARKSKVYDSFNHITEARTYGKDGRPETLLTWKGTYQTTFYVGFGVAGEDQATIVVAGNQVANLSSVQQMFNASYAGEPILSSDPAIRDFIKTVQTITISPRDLRKMNDAQLCSLFGWDIDAEDTAKCLQDVNTLIQLAGYEGAISLTYGSGDPVQVAMISAQAPNGTPPATMDVTLHTVVKPASPLGTAVGSVASGTGYSLLEFFSNAIGRTVHLMK